MYFTWSLPVTLLRVYFLSKRSLLFFYQHTFHCDPLCHISLNVTFEYWQYIRMGGYYDLCPAEALSLPSNSNDPSELNEQ